MRSYTSSFKRLFLVFLIFPLVVSLWGFALPCIYEETFLGELKHKIELLRTTDSPRIILVGGSAIAFGVDSDLLEEQLPGFHVVNFGMYAALGTSVMLDISQAYIKNGDIVILIPELQKQTLSGYFDADVMWQALDGDFGEILHLPKEKIIALAGSFFAFAGQKLRCFAKGEKMMPSSVYARSSFNEHGDVASPLCERNIMPNGVDIGMMVEYNEDTMDEWYVERLQEYYDLLMKKGATLWYGICPVNKAAIVEDDTLERYYEAILEKTDIPILGNPNDSAMAKEWFYDTNFHLNNSGKIVYTKQLIEAIKAMLSDSSQTMVDTLEMPTIQFPVAEEGDDSDEDCFVYKKTEEGYVVIEVMEEKERLIVPAHHDGEAVVVIESMACNAREIVIQANIRRIMNGAFAGCDNLEKIIMEQTSPSLCQVSFDLLEGTNADVYVPMALVNGYKTDYFWSIHSHRIHGLK